LRFRFLIIIILLTNEKRRDYKIKIAFKTLGCKVNQYETETLIDLCKEQNYEIVNFKEKADIYIINTCTVTREAERKSKQMIRKAIKKNRMAKIIVTGCSAQSSFKDLKEIEGVHYIVGNEEKKDILDFARRTDNQFPSIHVGSIKNVKKYSTLSKNDPALHTRSLVKIQDGCNNFCAYCEIPYVRGPQRSRKVDDILKEIDLLEEKGIKEVVLLGINLGSYGHDFSNKNISLAKLIMRIIIHCKRIERIRLSSIEVNHIDDELINVIVQYPKICRHLHIPLQSGNDKILKMMNRPYDLTFFSKKINKIRKKMPGISITTDIMVGFPGEDNCSFEHAYQYIKTCEFSKLHVFPYSDRDHCLSRLLSNKINDITKKERINRLLDLSNELLIKYRQKNIGKVKDILIETIKKDKVGAIVSYGMTDNYLRILIRDMIPRKGDLLKVRLKELHDDYILGKILQ